MERLDAVVKAYDVRGRVPDQLDADLAERLGRAAAAELGGPEFLVARDARPSSPELAEAFAAGVRAAGVGTVDLGLASTDLLWFASGHLALPGAMVTASHNPPGENGVKLCRAGAVPVSWDTGLAAIRDHAAAGLSDPPDPPRDATAPPDPPRDATAPPDSPRHVTAPPAPGTDGAAGARRLDLLDAYAAHVRGFVDPAALRRLTVVVDAGNGMAGLVAPALLAPLPVDVVLQCGELDGTFPNHPADPLRRESLDHAGEAVRSAGADLGLVLDGDADRLGCVDETGAPVRPSALGAILAAHLLADRPGEVVLHDLAASRIVRETIAAHGGQPVRTRVGHSYIRAVMRETGALFGAEHTGHYYFRDHYASDSGMVAAALLLEALSAHGGPLSSLAAPYEVYASSGEVSVPVDDPAAALARVEAALGGDGAVDRFDGVSVDADRWSVNVRPSNTEALVRVNVEAEDPAVVAQLRDRVLEMLAPAPATDDAGPPGAGGR